MIIAFAGRRVDAPGSDEVRFPAENVDAVREKIRAALIEANAEGLVCAAACGADLLALEVAGDLGLRRRVVLPYAKDRFRKSSVVDRPGDWGRRFDRILAEVEASGDVTINNYEEAEDAYFAANHDILDTAEDFAESRKQEIGALVAWNGVSRGEEDVTAHFLEEAKGRGLRVGEVLTV
jgi:hypothetical protein